MKHKDKLNYCSVYLFACEMSSKFSNLREDYPSKLATILAKEGPDFKYESARCRNLYFQQEVIDRCHCMDTKYLQGETITNQTLQICRTEKDFKCSQWPQFLKHNEVTHQCKLECQKTHYKVR